MNSYLNSIIDRTIFKNSKGTKKKCHSLVI